MLYAYLHTWPYENNAWKVAVNLKVTKILSRQCRWNVIVTHDMILILRSFMSCSKRTFLINFQIIVFYNWKLGIMYKTVNIFIIFIFWFKICTNNVTNKHFKKSLTLKFTWTHYYSIKYIAMIKTSLKKFATFITIIVLFEESQNWAFYIKKNNDNLYQCIIWVNYEV